ncbi:hypothetical protein COCON_G00024280 [Conger conger]|uniref:Uncharacterized protein n=1 Tax=Conger conger TaxID=82655 RepID=A0A9Q1DXI8_CONCO|nr:hypothetical protein COCON_G00024280 [Conger conger]
MFIFISKGPKFTISVEFIHKIHHQKSLLFTPFYTHITTVPHATQTYLLFTIFYTNISNLHPAHPVLYGNVYCAAHTFLLRINYLI